jgi:hypothetical protein
MKKLLLPLFLLGGVIAQADVVIEQNIESSATTGKMVMKIKGERARMDMPKNAAGAMSMVIDMKGGEVSILMHDQKMVMKSKIPAQSKEAIDAAKVEMPKATGKKEKVGEWDTEIFEGNVANIPTKMWVAKDFPNYKALMEQMNKLSAATGGGAAAKFDLGGMVVKTEMNLPAAGGKMTMTVLKVKEEPVAEDDLKVPADYKGLPGQ